MATDISHDPFQPRAEVPILTLQQILKIAHHADLIVQAVRRADRAAAKAKLNGGRLTKRGYAITIAKRNLFNYLTSLKS